jgi:predicted AAA+ superfamily ATPase
VLNLLDSRVFLPLSRDPAFLRQQITDPARLVVIDEIQKLPALLDEVHLLIEERGIRFLLTGSSARKLRRGGVNLLGGRARSYTLHPFCRRELGERFDLRKALSRGTIPSIYLTDTPFEDLAAYVGTYLQQEIAAEGLTRNVPAFSRVLEAAARYHGGVVNYEAISQETHTAASTVREYFQILADTLVARDLPAFTESRRREPLRSSKLFFFDVGVANFLLDRRGLRPRSPEFGFAFESFVFQELCAYADYERSDLRLQHWRSRSGFEVDFVIQERVALEIKAKDHVADRDLRGLRALLEEGMIRRAIVACMEERPRRVDAIEILPWELVLDELWGGSLIA